LNYSDKHLEDAKIGLTKLYLTIRDFKGELISKIDWNQPYANNFKQALDDDFNSSEAISILFELANEINKTNSSELLILLKSLAQILGLLSKDPEHFLQGNNSKDDIDIELMIKKRNDAKKNKNFQEADEIRANLLEKGILLEDTPEGTIWRKK
jgi:cysteinyl-tRNA synthetase